MPLLLMLVSSFKPNVDILLKPLSFPAKPIFTAYETLFVRLDYGVYIKNSVFVTISSLALLIIFSVLAAFYIARFHYKWNNAILFYFLVGMMLPIKLGLVPLFLLMKDLNLVNSLWSVIFIYIGTGLPMAVLILTGFFRTMPRELEEAAQIDGAGIFRMLTQVLVPLMKPAIGTVVIMNLISVWNDFFFPLIFIQDESKKTIPVGMQKLFSEFTTDWSVLFAGLTLSTLPLILVFFLASRQFMDGLMSGSIK